MAKKHSEDAQIDLTPMIDVVFQLIIFFIVTIKMDENINEDIILEDSEHGAIIKEVPPTTVILEIDRRGRLTMHNTPVAHKTLLNLLRNKYARYGQFPILIRADYRTMHQDIKTVMDICTMAGLWRINFAAVKEHKRTEGRHRGVGG